MRLTKFITRKTAIPAVSLLVIAAAAGLPASPARAQSFVIQDGQTAGGTQIMNNPGDVGIIESGGTLNTFGVPGVAMLNVDQLVDNRGTITTAGGITAINSNSANGVVLNSGSISTSGASASGITSTGANFSMENSGSISTTGNGSNGIQSAGAGATIFNSGSISIAGQAQGILSGGDDAAIVNSGTITTAADSASAIVTAGDRVTIVNEGSLSGQGLNAFGIFASGDDAQIVNAGSITVGGDTSIGIFSTGANTTITNCGSIAATGPNSVGILSSGANSTITNCGRVSSEQSDAIQFLGNEDNVLTLLPGTVIAGGITFGGGTDTLEVGNGLSIAMTFDKQPEIFDANGAPFAVSGNRIAVVDPTMFSTQDEGLADLTGGISSTVLTRLSSARSGGVAGATVSRPPRMSYKDGGYVDPADSARAAWAQRFGSIREQPGEGLAFDTDQRVSGVVSGVDAAWSARTRAGAFLGGSRGRAEHAFGTQESDVDSFFGGAYVSTLRGRTAFDLVLTGGRSNYEDERDVANNLAPGGIETARADYDGWFVSPEVTMTRPFWPLGRRVEQIVTLRYAGLFLDGFNETGASAFAVGDREVHLGVARAALALPFVRRSEDGGRSKLTLTGGVEGRSQFGDEDIPGVLLGQDIVFEAGGEGDVIAGFASVTGEHTMPNGLTAFVSLEGKLEDEGARQVSAWGGLKFRF